MDPCTDLGFEMELAERNCHLFGGLDILSELHLSENCKAGLPDGIFSNLKYQFWYILEGPAIEDVGIPI
jgi:hypothetical protein